jgi:hypothetical protein
MMARSFALGHGSSIVFLPSASSVAEEEEEEEEELSRSYSIN